MTTIGIYHINNILIDGLIFYCSSNRNNCSVIRLESIKQIDTEIDSLDILITSSRLFKKEISKVRIESNNCNIIVLGENDCNKTISYYLTSGASCYLNITEGIKDLFNAVSIVSQGGIYCPYPVFERSKSGNYIPDFSNKELEVVRLLRQGITSKEAAQILGVHIKTIEFHRNNVISKCDQKNFVGTLNYLIGNGIIPVA